MEQKFIQKGKVNMENYKELLVKQERTAKQKLYRVLAVVGAVIVGLLAFVTFNIIFLTVFAVMVVVAYFVFVNTDLEFEYLYLDKEISIDKIISKTKRKKAGSIDVNRIEIVAPADSHQLDSYKNRDLKLVDYSAGSDVDEQKLYTIIYDGNQKILVNFDDEFIKILTNIIPRKVFTS